MRGLTCTDIFGGGHEKAPIIAWTLGALVLPAALFRRLPCFPDQVDTGFIILRPGGGNHIAVAQVDQRHGDDMAFQAQDPGF